MSQTQLLERLAQENRVFFPEKPVFEQKLWYCKLKCALGGDTLSLTRAVFGLQATLEQLQEVHRLAGFLSARRTEHHNLMPLLAPFVVLGTVPDNFRQVKAYYRLSAAAWKMLTRASRATVERLAPFLKKVHCQRWVELIAQSNLSNPQAVLNIFNQGRPAGFVHYEHFWVGRAACDFKQSLSRLFHAFCKKLQATQEPHERTRLSVWLEALGSELYVDFLTQENPLAKNCTMDSLIRKVQKQWEQDTQLIKALEGEISLPLQVLIRDPVYTSQVTWRPLTQSKDLVVEGKLMRHCVGNAAYIRDCQLGDSFIFRGELTGTPMGTRVTAQFKRYANSYQCVQIKGRGNSSVAGLWIDQAQELADQLYGIQPWLNDVLDVGQKT